MDIALNIEVARLMTRSKVRRNKMIGMKTEEEIAVMTLAITTMTIKRHENKKEIDEATTTIT